MPAHDGARRLQSGVEIDTGDDGLQRIGEHAVAGSQGIVVPVCRDDQEAAELEAAGHGGKRVPADQRGKPSRHGAFRLVGKALQQRLGNDKPEHPVAQELEAFVGERGHSPGTRVGDGPAQQVPVGEPVAQTGLEFLELAPPHAHRMRVNSRPNRIARGQFQTSHQDQRVSQAQNRMSARPTRLRCGTMPTLASRLSTELSRLSPIMK